MALREKSKATDTSKSLNFLVKSFLAGGVAGMCSKTAVAPLDRIKILLQAHNNYYKHLGVFSGLQGIVKNEHLIGLYKGNGAQMVRVFPYAAVQFLSFEIYKKSLHKSLGHASHFSKFVAGSMAGVTAVLFTYPLDVVRARLAFQITGEHIYNGIFHTLVCIFKTEGGVRALYQGLSPTVLAMIPYAGLSFYVFERLKAFSLEYFPTTCGRPCSRNTGGLVLIVPAKLLCGGLAGAIAQSVSYPLDVARRRMQLSMLRPETYKFRKGCFSTLYLVFKEDGIAKGLYRGMSINYLRAIPMVAVSFATYELMKQFLGLDTGLDT
ncbi:graves disease carrier protein-like [Limulus polyphemus]|uniref:Graves disease carrier protein-like n=1 Tax=Limulus polyphemus TaxID=6850 RepID=A0ABM1SUQ4_LIMPO|nr:graves disease carrier protein-like [Limulus polyphemus]XP_022247359.1 graves disease carrier protein-like [Limulus polyphemus]XP_022247360.1 graves disease carrier protein-like [Limulus polyphemus]